MNDFVRVDVLIQLEQIACERAAMVAENLQRVVEHKNMAYSYDDFEKLVVWAETLRTTIRS